MSARRRPDWRRGGHVDATWWDAPAGAELGIYVRVNFHARTIDGATVPTGRPSEVFVTARGPCGSMLSHYGTDLGETLSLLLQHGHDLPSLRARFKRGSLALRVVERAWILAAEIGADVPALPQDLEAVREADAKRERARGGARG